MGVLESCLNCAQCSP